MRDPIHGYISYTEIEKKLMDTKPVQRLRGVKQTPCASLVYPGAVHTRFNHSVGTMHLAGEMCQKVLEQLEMGPRQKEQILTLTRIAGLLHDLGHGPFSHVFEPRVKAYWAAQGFSNISHEDYAPKIIFESELRNILRSYRIKPEEVCAFYFNPNKESFLRQFMNNAEVEGCKRFFRRFPCLIQILRSKIDADKLDFFSRDSYFTGTVEYGRLDIKRIVDSLVIYEGKLFVADSALDALIRLFEARYHMFNAVYFHKTVRYFDLLILDLIEEISRSIENYLRDTEKYLELDDAKLMSLFRQSRKRKVRELLGKWDNREVVWKEVFVQKKLYRGGEKRALEPKTKEELKAFLISKLPSQERREAKKHLRIDMPTIESIPSEVVISGPAGRAVLIYDALLEETVPLVEFFPPIESYGEILEVQRIYATERYKRVFKKIIVNALKRKRP